VEEHRKFTRIGFDSTVTLGNDDTLWEAHVVDISLNGLLVDTPEGWSAELGDEFDVDLLLTKSGDRFVVMRCRVAWQQGDKVGLERTEIGLEAMTHLRRIIELNTGDAQRVEREFSQLGLA